MTRVEVLALYILMGIVNMLHVVFVHRVNLDAKPVQSRSYRPPWIEKEEIRSTRKLMKPQVQGIQVFIS